MKGKSQTETARPWYAVNATGFSRDQRTWPLTLLTALDPTEGKDFQSWRGSLCPITI